MSDNDAKVPLPDLESGGDMTAHAAQLDGASPFSTKL